MVDLNAISLYTGAGGMDFGVESAGFKVCAGVEIDEDCSNTVLANRDWPIIRDDIIRVPSSQIVRQAGLVAGDVDLLFGGPPCQPFSKAGYWTNGNTRRLEDPRARTLFEFMRVVEELRPAVFLLENVHGITYSGKEEGFRYLTKTTDKINRRRGTDYKLSWQVLDAARYGVPQHRSRFFLVGSQGGLSFRFPAPTHAPHEVPSLEQGQRVLFGRVAQPEVTSWDALSECSPPGPREDLVLKGYWADLVPSIPEGQNYLWHTDRGGGEPLFGWRTRYWSFLLKLAKSKPSWTIPAQPGPAIGPLHWTNRYLSVSELAALQTFPKELAFVGGRGSIQRQIGNAVPSLLAEIIAREIRKQLLGSAPTGNPVLSVALHRPIPAAEPTTSVPRKYLKFRGHHPAHPGTRRGPRGLVFAQSSLATSTVGRQVVGVK